MQTRCTSMRVSAMLLVVCAAVLAALALAVGAAAVQPACAYASTSWTATATPYYRNPATGVIEDSGGEDSEVLGQSMTEGATYPYAFLEMDDWGNRYVTIRLSLMDNIQNVNIMADDDWTNAYYVCSPQVVQTDDSAATADFRMLVGSEGAIFRINMYVVPMGREVIFYVALSNFSEGNPYGFYEEGSSGSGSGAVVSGGSGVSAGVTAAPSAAGSAGATAGSATTASPAGMSAGMQQLKAKIADAETQLKNSTKTDEQNAALQEALDAAKAVLNNADATDEEITAAAEALGTALDTFKNSFTAGSVADSAEGIQEFDASGNKVSQDGEAAEGSITVPVSTLVVGGVALVVIVAGLLWFFAYYRPRHVGGPASAAAAAAAPAGGAFRPYEVGPAVLAEEEPDGPTADDAPVAAANANKDGRL